MYCRILENISLESHISKYIISYITLYLPLYSHIFLFLVRWALALVLPAAVICCPGFPGCSREVRPWVLSLGAVIVRHNMFVV